MLPFVFFAAVLGLITGSFLTVVVHRTRHGGTIVWGRSSCVSCRKTLSAGELIPLASFILQRGRCRSCAHPIPAAYPLIELLSALLFGAAAWLSLSGMLFSEPLAALARASGIPQDGLAFLYYALLIGTALAVSFYDMLYFEIPAVFLAPAVLFAAAAYAAAALGGQARNFLFALGGGAGAFTLFWLIWFLSRGRAMGRGDADVAFILPFVLGPVLGSAAILFGFWLGAGYGILMLIFGRATWKSAIPFAPFLFAGALIMVFSARPFLEFITRWYGI